MLAENQINKSVIFVEKQIKNNFSQKFCRRLMTFRKFFTIKKIK